MLSGGPKFEVRLLSAEGLRALDAARWDALSADAVTENPFYARSHVMASLATLDAGAGLGAVAIEARDGALAALFPYRRRRVLPFPFALADAAANVYQSSGVPLVSRCFGAAAMDAWLNALGTAGLPRYWSFGHFDRDSALGGLLDQRAAALGRRIVAVDPYERPHLSRLEGGFEAHLAEAMPRRRVREIQRSLRRLRERGTVGFEQAADPALVARRLEQFLAMEHAGWKGRQGTSFLSDADAADFARRAYGGPAGLSLIDSLLLDGEPIAMSINIATGDTAFTPKCAYDETWRSYAPGLVLEYLVVEHFYAGSRFAGLDSAATVSGHVVGDLWNGQRRMARLFVGPDDRRTDLLAGVWRGRQAVRGGAKAALARLFPRRPAILTRLMRRLGTTVSTFVGATLIALPELTFWLKRQEWATAPLAAII